MACERCGCLPSDENTVAVLLSVPEAFVRMTLEKQLAARGLCVRSDQLGLHITLQSPSDRDRILEAFDELSEPFRRDIRAAFVPAPGDELAVSRALFSAKSVQEHLLLRDGRWFIDLLHQERMVTYFHPIVSSGQQIFAHECLIRGLDLNNQIISPGKLFSTARTLDMLFQLDQRSRLCNVRSVAAARPAPNAMFFINFLPTAIYDPNHCLKSTTAAINSSQLAASQFCFEVVESEHVADRDHLKRILTFYRERGFKVALDDMGEGNSSVMSLAELKPDFVKLDGELVRRAARSRFEGHLVRELAHAARNEGITVIAEGIETIDQLDWVHDAGIQFTQGYIWGKPAPELTTKLPSLNRNNTKAA